MIQCLYAQKANKIETRYIQQTPDWVFHPHQNNRLHLKINVDEQDKTNRPIGSEDLLAGAPVGPVEPTYLEGKVFVKFKAAAADRVRALSANSTRNGDPAGTYRSMMGNVNIKSIVGFSPGSSFRNSSNIFRVTLGEDIALEDALKILNEQPDIEYAERVPVYYLHITPNDPSYSRQNALKLINAPQAFDLSTTSNKINLAVIDDAFLFDHPDLKANVDRSKCYDVANNDDDTRPPSTGDNKAGPQDFSHGTHVGGIAGAVTNNSLGVASISYNRVNLFGIKATSDDTDDTRTIEFSFEGVQKAIENGAKIISMSFGGAGVSNAWQELINEGTANGIIFVSSAGNGNTSVKSYPAAYDNVIAVANTDERDRKNASSHFGDWVDISAPGTSILSTVVGDDGTSGAFASYSGTSMSAPMVAGLIALMLAENPALTPAQILNLIQITADNIIAVNGGFEGLLGAGRINAYNAMLAVKGLSGQPVARFISSNADIYTNQVVNFSSQSLGNNLTYSWSFPGGTPSAATEEFVQVRYATPGVYNVQLRATNQDGSDQIIATSYVTVVELQACEIIGFPQPGTRSFYSFVDDDGKSLGPVVGHNVNEFNKYANVYNAPAGYFVSGGLFAIGKVVSPNLANAKISFKIWENDSRSNRPGKALATQDVSFDKLVRTTLARNKNDRASYTEIIFENPAAVPTSGKFYMGFEIYYNQGDTLGLFTNDVGQGDGQTSFAFVDGEWIPFQALEFEANIEMSPIIIGEGFLNIEPFQAEAGACAGGSVNFKGDAIQNVTTYAWKFPGGQPATSAAANPSVQYNTPGEYEVELIVTLEGCDVARRRSVQTVKIVDCTKNPVADFTADKLVIAAGDSVQFINQSTNETGYSWIFEGGEPSTASIENPVVRYDSPGAYEVRLEVQNPLAQANQTVKENFITVIAADACDFALDYALNDPFPGDPILYVSPDGYVTGTNGTGDLAKAEYFGEGGSSRELDSLYVFFGVAMTNDDQSTVDIAIFDDNGVNGKPGDIIATKTLKIIDIKNNIDNNRLTKVVFDEPVIIEGPFYAGVLLDLQNTTDTVAIVSSTDDDIAEGTSWEQLATGTWVASSERWSSQNGTNPLDISLYISVYFNPISKIPFASFSVDKDTVNLGATLEIDASSAKGYTSFSWQVTPEIAVDDNLLRQDILFTHPGNYTITFTATNDCSRTSTYTRNIFVRSERVTGVEDKIFENEVLQYPNPFGDQTTIAYFLQKPAMVMLEIYNGFGQMVNTLVKENKQPGKHFVVFDASNLASGMYIYRLRIGDGTVHTGRLIRRDD